MAERPVIFSAPMVRAILEGRKTQTRRVLKVTTPVGERVLITSPYERAIVDLGQDDVARGEFHYLSTDGLSGPYRLPAAPGDLLWVRETWADPTDQVVVYRANWREDALARGLDNIPETDRDVRWRPSIHMPRWASRITLRVTDVRVERLQDISEADAVAEGFIHSRDPSGDGTDSRELFAMLWNAIHSPAAWDANPWVAAISFERVHHPRAEKAA